MFRKLFRNPLHPWFLRSHRPTVPGRSAADNLEKSIPYLKSLSKSISTLNSQITLIQSKVKSKKANDKLIKKLTSFQQNYVSLSIRFDSQFRRFIEDVTEINYMVLTLLHITEEVVNKVSKRAYSKKYPAHYASFKQPHLTQLHSIKTKILKIATRLYEESRNNENRRLSPALLRATVSIQGSVKKMKLVRTESINIDNIWKNVKAQHGEIDPKHFNTFIENVNKQVESIREIGEHIKIITHRSHKFLKPLQSNKLAKRYQKRLNRITTHTKRFYNYLWKRANRYKPQEKAGKIIKFQTQKRKIA